jgi:hypothetical protein
MGDGTRSSGSMGGERPRQHSMGSPGEPRGQLPFELDCSDREVTAASFAPGPEDFSGVFACSVAPVAEEAVAALERASQEHVPVRLLFRDYSLLLGLATVERKNPQSVRIIGQLLATTRKVQR